MLENAEGMRMAGNMSAEEMNANLLKWRCKSNRQKLEDARRG